MLKNLTVENFRGLKSFKLDQLGRVNLLVGSNNCGKTSLLEALYLLLSTDPVRRLGQICVERNELSYIEDDAQVPRKQVRLLLHVIHLFHGHDLRKNNHLRIKAEPHSSQHHELAISIGLVNGSQNSSNKQNSVEIFPEELQLKISHEGYLEKPLEISLSPEGAIVLNELQLPVRYNIRLGHSNPQSQARQSQFVRAAGISIDSTLALFDNISLTPEEDLVIQTLQTIEPNLQRIGPEMMSQRFPGDSSKRGGFKVKLKGQDQPVPIGSMGEGMWRMLGLALAIVSAKDGVLLIDEIDTGLHFTVMTEMWRMICKTAQELNVQVFATTHSNDCWQSLAELAHNEDIEADQVILHRIHPDRESSVTFDGEELAIAAQRDLEVR